MCQDFRSTRSASSAHTGKSNTKNKEVLEIFAKARNTILALVAGIQIIVVVVVVVVAVVVAAAARSGISSSSSSSNQ